VAEQLSATKSEKAGFGASHKGAINSADILRKTLDSYEQIPDFVEISGKVGESGVAITTHDRVISALRHPHFIPKFKPGTFEWVNGYPEYFGTQEESHISTSMAEPLGVEYSKRKAKELVEHIKEFGFNGIVHKTGFGTLGVEEENLHFDSKNIKPKDLPAKDQYELQSSVKELGFDPASHVSEQAKMIAESRIKEAIENPESVINSTSFSMASRPDEFKMNSGVLGEYINAVAFHMFNNYFDPKDELSIKYWNKIAENSGYKDFSDLKNRVGDLTPLTFVAAHVSLGLRSENVDGSYRIGLEEGIAVSDMVNSNFGSLLEWMTYSTPLAFGERVGIEINGETKYPKDARAIARLGSRTAYPGDFIMTPENYKNRVVEAIVEGQADRIDRSGYIAYHEDRDEKITNPHARVRFRVAPNEGKDKFKKRLGRVEFVGGGNTPDIVALTSRNALLQLMGLGAYEATANGQHPVYYFRDKFPSISSCDGQIVLNHSYNFGGSDHPKANALIEEGRAFVEYMRQNYKHEDIQYLADVAEMGINKLWEKTEAKNLDEYLKNPKGNISDVIVNMYNSGMKAEEITRRVADFEVKQAKKVMEYDGDVRAMMRNDK
jgi:hypothetical protein